MSDQNNDFAISLTESPQVTTTIKCQIPGTGVDVWRDFEFEATFKVLSEEDQDGLPITATKRDVLREVLVSVGKVPGAKVRDADGAEIELTPVDVVIRNAFLSDAAHAKYQLLLSKNTRDLNTAAAMSTVSKGNSKRSRSR